MKRIITLAMLMIVAVSAGAKKHKSMSQLTREIMDLAATQCIGMSAALEEGKMPRTFDGGRLVTSGIDWWCSGFYPGTMWYVYEYSGREDIKELAQKYTVRLAPLLTRKTYHDIGFQLFCSYGNAYRLTGNEEYLHVIHEGAEILARRFNPVTGCIRSWDFSRDRWKFPVIIDNMMNLELLMWVGNHFNDPYLKTVAITHANTTMRNHFRTDYGSFHLVDYDPATGKALKKQTVQGFADGSKWARGQAWALYGYTMMFRTAGAQCYLEQARSIADMLIPLLPDDGVPYWDFDSPLRPDDLRDASAAAIMASALVELSGYVPEKRDEYLAVAERQLRTLASPEYMAEAGTNGNFILKHSVGSKPGNSEVDVPLTYADYYFIEALVRMSRIEK